MTFYDSVGYVDIDKILKICRVPFIFIIGGRGTGKTYTALKWTRDNHKIVMFMRRTGMQIESIMNPLMNPYKSLSINEKFNYHCEPLAKHIGAVIEDTDEEHHKLLAYMTALSTIASLRGFDASDVDTLVFDEFISEKHERRMKEEADAFFNAYETLNRNRELQGREPIQCLFLANANQLDNPIFVKLGIVRKVTAMQQKKQDFTIDKERGYAVVLLNDSPISEKKKLTALYRLTSGNYSGMAIENEFVYDDLTNVRSKALAEFEPIAKISDIYIYRHKNNRIYYCSKHGRGSPPEYQDTKTDRIKFTKEHSVIKKQIILGNVFFEDYDIKSYLTSLYNM